MERPINIYKRTSVQRPQVFPENFQKPPQFANQKRFNSNSDRMNENLNHIQLEVYPSPSNHYQFDNKIRRNRSENDRNQTKQPTFHKNYLRNRQNMNDPSVIDSNSFEQHANEIVTKLEQDSNLMEDNPTSEQLRRQVLRDIPQCLTVKKCIKVKLTKSVSQKSKRKPIGCFKRMRYMISFGISKFKTDVKNFFNSIELWYSTMKSIEGHFGSGIASYFKLFRWLFLLNLFTAITALIFICVPQICYDLLIKNSTAHGENEFEFEDIFTGDGYFKQTLLYYGFYTNNSIQLNDSLFYSIPNAYFFTIFVIYLISFIVISFSGAKSYRRSYIETEGGLKNIYANKIFCGWDFSIATKEAAQLKSSAIYNELKELLSESMSYKRKQTFLHKLKTFLWQLIVNLLIILMLIAIGYATWLLLKQFGSIDNTNHTQMIATAIIINFILLLVPLIFTCIIRCEEYKNPRTVLYVTLFRTYLLSFIIVGVLISFWLIQSKNDVCWETNLGEEIYRLVLFDFIISTVLSTIFETVLFICQRLTKIQVLHNFEFNIARYTLQLIYNQSLLWVGLFFSPLLPAIVVIKLFITWYIQTISVHKLCKPPTRTWRAAQTQTWFLIMTFFSLIVIIVVHGYIIMKVLPSTNCGPFKEYNYIYELITKKLSYLEESHVIWKLLMYLTKPGTVALIIIALCIPVYYLREKAQAERAIVNMLRQMLTWQSKDKEFLLKYIDKVTNGEWKYNLNDSRFDDPINSLPSQKRHVNERASLLQYSDSSSEASDLTWRYKKYS